MLAWLWANLWPNMVAPSLPTLAWCAFLHLRARAHVARHFARVFDAAAAAAPPSSKT